jgi:hypothetical protein
MKVPVINLLGSVSFQSLPGSALALVNYLVVLFVFMA